MGKGAHRQKRKPGTLEASTALLQVGGAPSFQHVLGSLTAAAVGRKMVSPCVCRSLMHFDEAVLGVYSALAFVFAIEAN